MPMGSKRSKIIKVNDDASTKQDEEFLETESIDLRSDEYKRTHQTDRKLDDRVRDYVHKRITRITEMVEARNQAFKEFNGMTLLEYIEESQRRLNGQTVPSDFKDAWQADVFDNVTRNKYLAILARISAQRMKAHFINDDDLDPVVGRIISNLYEKRARGKNGVGNDSFLLFNSLFECGSKGTVVVETCYKDGRRRVKTSKDPKSGAWKYKTLFEWEDTWSQVVPLEEFYPGDIKKLLVQEMGDCAVISKMSYDDFKIKYGDYSNISKVVSCMNMTNRDLEEAGINDAEAGDDVFVMRYYNRNSDSYDLIANGILLTPMGNPLPNAHKQLPFVSAQHERIANNFFYGMSFPHKLSSFQDMNNALLNMMLDMMFIALKTPIFNATGKEIDSDWLYPNQVINLPKGTNTNSIQQYQMNTHLNEGSGLLGIIQSRMNESASISHEGTGVSGVGRSKTAEEVATAREAAMEIIGLFLRQMEWLEENRAEQVIQIMLEKYPQRLKSTGKYRRFIIDSVRLLNEEMGKVELNITEKPRDKQDLNMQNLKTPEVSQVIDITPAMIMNVKGFIKIVPGSSIKETEDQAKKSEIAWYELTKDNQLINQKENIKQLADRWGKDVNKIMKTESSSDFASLINGMKSGQPIPVKQPASRPSNPTAI